MKNYIAQSEKITHTATAAINSGEMVYIGAVIKGVAEGDAAIGENVVLMTSGIFKFTKAAASDLSTLGTAVYWDGTNKVVTADDDTGNNLLVGHTMTSIGADAGTVEVLVSL